MDKATKRVLRNTSFVFGPLLLLILAIVIVFSFRGSLTSNFYSIKGSSMYPTLSEGEKVEFKTSKELSKNDIVVFKEPNSWTANLFSRQNAIKRVVATEGDVFSISDHSVKVNGKVIYSLPQSLDCKEKEGYSYQLQDRKIAVAGDNHEVSVDSARIICSGRGHPYIDLSDVIEHGEVVKK